jgi:hypothetical protein
MPRTELLTSTTPAPRVAPSEIKMSEETKAEEPAVDWTRAPAVLAALPTARQMQERGKKRWVRRGEAARRSQESEVTRNRGPRMCMGLEWRTPFLAC